jgi:hypothetical protein
MLRALATVAAVIVLVAAPVTLVSGATDTLDEQVNAAVDARNDAMDQVMVDEVEETVDEMEDEPEVFDPSEFMEDDDQVVNADTDLVTYQVDGDEISDPETADGLSGEADEVAEDTAGHERAWDLFSRITDEEHEGLISEFVIFTDGFQGILAAVAPTPPEFGEWTVYVDGADLEDEGELVLTMAHEYAHILTLESSQIEYSDSFLDPSAPLPDCGTQVALPEGCAASGSYWEAFYPFWEPIEAEHGDIEELQFTDEQEYFTQLEAFYGNHQDEFVTPYSATSQAEDMAESFSYWVVDDDPDFGGVAQEKIEFWNQFPELVELREQARENLGLD